MAKEIERKFLIDHQHPEVLALMTKDPKRIEQGYITTSEKGVVRVRIIDGAGFLTIKSATPGITRDEYEFDIPVYDAASLLRDLCVASLKKERRCFALPEGLTVDLDYFPDHDLYLAEVELPDETAAFDHPAWFTQEVSHDPAYFNNNLATVIAPKESAPA